jgi:hypothetical protein
MKISTTMDEFWCNVGETRGKNVLSRGASFPFPLSFCIAFSNPWSHNLWITQTLVHFCYVSLRDKTSTKQKQKTPLRHHKEKNLNPYLLFKN